MVERAEFEPPVPVSKLSERASCYNFLVTAGYVASDWVVAGSGERLDRLIRGVEEEGWRFVAFVRLVPRFRSIS
jgi:uncharacterized membrane protein YdjX (TVP38/TMEM64 family)